MTLTDFLLARIAEEEAAAREAYEDLADLGDEPGTGWATSGGYEHNNLSAPGYVFTRRWSPERVLAECVAKRRIVAAWGRLYGAPPLRDEYARQAAETAGHVFRELAAVYAEHPDYRPEWRP